MKANKFVISNLNALDKITNIEHSIHSHDGVNAVRVDMQANTITIDYDESRYSKVDIQNLIAQTGLNVIKVE